MLTDEHDHAWQPTGDTKTIGGIEFEIDRCTLPGCNCRRARRPDLPPAPDREAR